MEKNGIDPYSSAGKMPCGFQQDLWILLNLFHPFLKYFSVSFSFSPSLVLQIKGGKKKKKKKKKGEKKKKKKKKRRRETFELEEIKHKFLKRDLNSIWQERQPGKAPLSHCVLEVKRSFMHDAERIRKTRKIETRAKEKETPENRYFVYSALQ